MQYGIYYLCLTLFEYFCPEMSVKVTLAFTLGFGMEMISNYLLTSFYTFRTRPNIKNAGGFLLGRLVNYFIQLGFLHLLIYIGLSEEWSGIVAIVLAGIINYFVLVPFYSKKKSEKKNRV